jgi:hypothetical protein
VRNPVNPLLSYRGFFGSPDHLPIVTLLERINAQRPFWFPFYDGTIGPQQTDFGQIVMQNDTWLIALMASSSQAAGFVAQLFDTQTQMEFEDQPISFPIHFGTAQQPFYLKKPQKLPSQGQIEARVINLASAANTIQIIGLAYRPDLRVKLT